MPSETMANVALGKRFIIQNIDDTCPIKNRLFDIGITRGAELFGLFKSPLGDPTAYLVSDTVIALRKHDTEKIEVISLA